MSRVSKILIAVMIASSAPMVSGCIPSCTPTNYGCIYM